MGTTQMRSQWRVSRPHISLSHTGKATMWLPDSDFILFILAPSSSLCRKVFDHHRNSHFICLFLSLFSTVMCWLKTSMAKNNTWKSYTESTQQMCHGDSAWKFDTVINCALSLETNYICLRCRPTCQCWNTWSPGVSRLVVKVALLDLLVYLVSALVSHSMVRVLD